MRWSSLTLVCSPDNTFDVQFNGESKVNGSLLEDFNPAVNPPKEIPLKFPSARHETCQIT